VYETAGCPTQKAKGWFKSSQSQEFLIGQRKGPVGPCGWERVKFCLMFVAAT